MYAVSNKSIEVCNLRTHNPFVGKHENVCIIVDKDDEIIHIRCDRKSPLGNPYDMQRSEKLRDAVVNAHNGYFVKKVMGMNHTEYQHRGGLNFAKGFTVPPTDKLIHSVDWLDRRLREGYTLKLYCWCSPKRCHADNIADWLTYKTNLPPHYDPDCTISG